MVSGMEMIKFRYACGFKFQLIVQVIEGFFGICFKIPKGMVKVKKYMLIFHLEEGIVIRCKHTIALEINKVKSTEI